MIRSICIDCGAQKSDIWSTCPECGLDPNRDEDVKLKSFYYSTGRFSGEEDRIAYAQELARISVKRKNGEDLVFDAHDLSRLKEQLAAYEAIKTKDLVLFLVRLFAPGLMLLLIFVAVYLLLHYINTH
jgi:hypothetical protein